MSIRDGLYMMDVIINQAPMGLGIHLINLRLYILEEMEMCDGMVFKGIQTIFQVSL